MKLFSQIIVTTLLFVPTAAMSQGLIPNKNDKDKWGYMNERGDQVIDFKYDEAGNFSNGVATVKKGNNMGVIDVNGKEILPVKYNLIERHNSNIYKVAADGKFKDGVLLEEKYGFVDNQGKELLKPEYDEIGLFKNGLAYVKKGDLYGYITEDIKTVVPCKYNAVGSFNESGYTWVSEGAKYEKGSNTKFSGGKFGIFYKDGTVIVPPKYKAAGYFIPYVYVPKEEYLKTLGYNHKTVLEQSGSHHLFSPHHVPTTNLAAMPEDVKGFYASTSTDAKKNAVFALDGKVLVKEGNKFNTVYYPTDGYAMVAEGSNKYNFLNVATGKLLFKRPFYDAWAFDEGVAVVTRDGSEWQLVDTDGKTVSASFKNIFPKKDGVYIVQSVADSQKILYGAIDKRGNEVIVPNHIFVYPPSGGLMACGTNDNQMGYKDPNGNWIIKGDYKGIRSFIDGKAVVGTPDGWGMIDTSGNQVVKCQWKDCITLNSTKSGYMWVTDETGDKPGFMLLRISDDKVVSPDKYQWIRVFGSDFDDVAMVGKDGNNIGLVTKEGKLIVPACFSYAQARTAYEYLKSVPGKQWDEFDTYRVKLYSNPNRNKGKLTSKLESSLWDY